MIVLFSLILQQVVYEAQELLDKQDGVTPVHNRFYDLSSNYHKLMGNHAEYYRDALRFLGCTELGTIPGKTRFSSKACQKQFLKELNATFFHHPSLPTLYAFRRHSLDYCDIELPFSPGNDTIKKYGTNVF